MRLGKSIAKFHRPVSSTKDGKFNNVQPVVNADGCLIEGMLLFYGWKDQDKARSKGFFTG